MAAALLTLRQYRSSGDSLLMTLYSIIIILSQSIRVEFGDEMNDVLNFVYCMGL